MYPNNNCNTCNDCPPICIIFTVGAEAFPSYSCSVEQAGTYNNKPYYQLYAPGCTQLANIFVWWNIITNRWEFTEALGSGQVLCYNMNPGLYPISNSGFNWIEDEPKLIMISSLEGPCPGPLPLPDLSSVCGDEYDAACVIYTGPDIKCLGITSGMTFLEILIIFNNVLPGCDCCEKIPVNCVVGPWGPWGQCECYYEDELLVCGRERRTRNVITLPENGGTPCPPLVEYRPCTVSSMCFTFGSAICESEPLGTQVIAAPSGVHDNKPYYSFSVCGNPQSVWWSNADDQWHISNTVGVPLTLDCTLDNNDNYYPVSNTTTQLWHNPQDGIYLDIIQSTLNTCPTYLICFHLQLTIGGNIYNFYNSVAPVNTPFDTGDHPVYFYSVSDGSASHNVSIYYYPGPNQWTARVDGVIIGTLASTDLYPYGTWVANPSNPGNYFVSATLGGSCIQPPDVPCVLNCGPWSACIGGTQTRTCTVVTPPSGNVAPCPPLIQTQVCAVPNCFPPTAVVATQTGSAVVISFTGASGAASYQVSYSIDGGTPVLLSGVTSPITLPYTCDATYTGTIVTQCSNGLTSSPVSWGPITTDACGFCGTEPPHPMIGGTSITSPVGGTVALNSTGDTQYLGNLNFGSTGYSVREIVLIPSGYIYAGQLNSVSSSAFPTVSGFFGAILIGCDFQPIPSFFGSGFTTALGAQGTVYGVTYDAATDRIYVGGSFAKYKGVNCTPNFVVLKGSDGNIDTTFATNAVGAARTTGFVSVNSIAIQNDGKILVAGAFDSMYGNTTNCKYICRFLPTGVIDTSFNPGASITSSTPQNNLYVVKVNAANDIFIGGSFTAYQGTARNCIAKLTSTGALNTTFNPGTLTFSGACTVAYVKDIEFQGSNIIFGGTISTYNGTTVHGLVRVNAATAVIDPTFNLYVPTFSLCSRVSRIIVKNNRIHIGTTWTSYNTSNKALYYVLDANGTPAFNTTVVITTGTSSSIDSILLMP